MGLLRILIFKVWHCLCLSQCWRNNNLRHKLKRLHNFSTWSVIWQKWEYSRIHQCVHISCPHRELNYFPLPPRLPWFAVLINRCFFNLLNCAERLRFAAVSLYFCLLVLPLQSLCLSAHSAPISSFESVMIPLCWDYVCVLHAGMGWLFIACCILIPQLKEWDDTCREPCVSCSLTWKNDH